VNKEASAMRLPRDDVGASFLLDAFQHFVELERKGSVGGVCVHARAVYYSVICSVMVTMLHNSARIMTGLFARLLVLALTRSLEGQVLKIDLSLGKAGIDSKTHVRCLRVIFYREDEYRNVSFGTIIFMARLNRNKVEMSAVELIRKLNFMSGL
jgi:hypothetical protein